MQEQAFTPMHRARLDAQLERAHEDVRAATKHAVETGAKMPPREAETSEMRLYHKAGNAAFFFCVWFSFVAPIILILTLWD